MSRFVIIAMLTASPVTYLYEDPDKALAKVRTLQRLMTPFEFLDGRTKLPLTVAELEDLQNPKQ